MKTVRLGDVCDVVMGQAPDGATYNTDGDGWPLLAGAGDFGERTPRPSKYTSEPTKLSSVGDIILCIRATIGDLNWSEKSYCLGRGVAGLKPKKGELYPGYLWHWMTANKSELAKRGKGSTFKQVSRDDIKTLDLSLPDSFDEQRRIAAILDKADAIRRKRQQALALADDFLRSAFLEMFGDPVTNPMKLQSEPLGAVATFISGGTPSKERADYWDGSFPWVSPKDMKREQIVSTEDGITELAFHETSLRRVPPKTVLIVVRGMILAHTVPVALSMVPLAINQDMKGIQFIKGIDPEYALWCLRTQHKHMLTKIDSAAHGTKRFDLDQLKSLPILIPNPDDQRRFIKLYSAFHKTRDALLDEAINDETLFASLSQRAFRGEL